MLLMEEQVRHTTLAAGPKNGVHFNLTPLGRRVATVVATSRRPRPRVQLLQIRFVSCKHLSSSRLGGLRGKAYASRMTRVLALVVLSTVLNATPVSVAPQTGNDLIRICVDDPGPAAPAAARVDALVSIAECGAYVHGLVDGILVSRDWAGQELVCFPGEVTLEQTIAIVRKRLTEVPEKRHLRARDLVFAALLRAFPCATKSK